MRVYLAGNTIGQEDCHSVYTGGVRNKLLTFAEVDDWARHAFEFWVYNKPDDAHIFMDCGAFSALSRGVTISIDRYIEFCHKWKHNIAEYVQLDKVGDAVTTRRNLEIMESAGLAPLPVYTAMAPISELERLCEKYPHIALGGLRGKVAGSNDWRKRKFDEIFRAVRPYWPRRFHAFGITSQWVLERYPLYSADSSSAIVGGGMGRVMTFDKGILRSEPWVEYARRTYNGEVMDKIGNCGTTGTTSAHWGRRIQNIHASLEFEAHMTRLWEYRGVTW